MHRRPAVVSKCKTGRSGAGVATLQCLRGREVRKRGLREKPVEYKRLPADMDYRFFDFGRRARFAPGRTSFSPATAWWLSEFSHLAYTHPGFARMALELAGFRGFRYFNGPRTDCIVAWRRRLMVIAFRGTDRRGKSAPYEIVTNLSVLPKAFPAGGRVHGGFLDAFNEVWQGKNSLQEFLKEMTKSRRRRVWITGHSLGGALGSLCFSSFPAATGLYTFGSPRVGDKEYVRILSGRPVYRVEHARDPVPFLPPDTPGLSIHYEPYGKLIYITRDGELLTRRPRLETAAEPEPVEEIRGALAGFIREARESIEDYFENLRLTITDHLPIHYSAKLWNAYVNRKEPH